MPKIVVDLCTSVRVSEQFVKWLSWLFKKLSKSIRTLFQLKKDWMKQFPHLRWKMSSRNMSSAFVTWMNIPKIFLQQATTNWSSSNVWLPAMQKFGCTILEKVTLSEWIVKNWENNLQNSSISKINRSKAIQQKQIKKKHRKENFIAGQIFKIKKTVKMYNYQFYHSFNYQKHLVDTAQTGQHINCHTIRKSKKAMQTIIY